MKQHHLTSIGLTLLACVSLARAADPAPAASSPPPSSATGRADAARDLEPAVNTSAPVPSQAASAAPTSAAAKPGAKASDDKARERSTTQPASPAGAPRTGRVIDKLSLDATQVTGNSELPKVLYIVPWKHADPGDLNGRPMNSLLDEVLTPIDRDVFRRENRYYDALEAGQAAPEAQGARDEK